MKKNYIKGLFLVFIVFVFSICLRVKADTKVNWIVSGQVQSNLYYIFNKNNIDILHVDEIIINNKLVSGITYATENALDLSKNKDRSVLGFVLNNKLYIEFSGILELEENAYGLFSDFPDVTNISGLEYIDTSNVTSMLRMFYGAGSLTSLDLSSFDTSKVTDMASMFLGAESLTSLDLSNFDTSKVTNMYGMFSYCTALENINLSSFNTSNVTNMSSMFKNMTHISTLDLSNFNTSKVTDVSNMFNNMSSINKIYVSKNFVLNGVVGTGISLFDGSTNLIGGAGTTYEEARQEYFLGFDVIDSVEHPGLFSYKYNIINNSGYELNNYINVGTGSLDSSKFSTDDDEVTVVYENNKLKFKYNNLTIKQIDIVSYSSDVYNLNLDEIDTGSESFNINNINVINASKEVNNGILYIKYGETVLKNYKIYSDVRFARNSANLYVGGKYDGYYETGLTNYAGTYNSELDTYYSSDPSIASVSVDELGIFTITAVDTGTATITATLKNGKSATFTAHVYNPVVNSITADITEYNKTVDDESFNLNVVLDAGSEHPAIQYLNTNKDAVTVDDDGNVTIIGPGHADIYVVCGGKYLEVTIDVLSHIKSISIIPSGKMYPNTTRAFIATLNPENTTDDKMVTWSTSDTSIIKLHDDCNSVFGACNFDILKAGTVTITATTSNNKSVTETLNIPARVDYDSEVVRIKNTNNDNDYFEVGTKINLEITPYEKYDIKSVKIFDLNNNDVTSKVNYNNNSFILPDYSVRIDVQQSKQVFKINYNDDNVTFEVYNGNTDNRSLKESPFGDTIYINIQPKERYLIKDIRIIDDLNQDITDDVDFVYNKSFIMPTNDVTIKVTSEYQDFNAPTLSFQSIDNNSLIITWDEQKYVDMYTIYRSIDGKKWTYKGWTTSNKDEDSNLSYNTTYHYKVVASNYMFNKEVTSNIISKKIVPNKVENLKIASVGPKNIKISWDKVPVTGYEVYMGKKKVATIKKNGTLTYNKTKLKPNTKYTFKVRAYKTVKGKKIYGTFSDQITIKTAPTTPKTSISLKDYNALNIKVKAVAGASKYEIVRSTSKKGTYTKVGEIVSGTYTDENLTTGSTYYYKVRACNTDNNCGSYSSIVSKKVIPNTPTISTQALGSKIVNISTTSVNGVDGYEIYRSTSKKKGYKKITEITDLENLTYEDTTPKKKTYYYKIKAYKIVNGKRVYSSWSKIKKVKVK